MRIQAHALMAAISLARLLPATRWKTFQCQVSRYSLQTNQTNTLSIAVLIFNSPMRVTAATHLACTQHPSFYFNLSSITRSCEAQSYNLLNQSRNRVSVHFLHHFPSVCFNCDFTYLQL